MGISLLISLFILMFLGIPIAFAIELSGVFFLLATDARPLSLVAQRMVLGMDSFPLLAVPLFVLAGSLMEHGGISKRLVNWAETLVGWLPGSLGMVTIVACAIFAALTGSGPATVAAIGSLMIPSMIKSGYPPEAAAGLTAAAGILGPIIPPSVAMIVYGVTMNLSIPKMFIGGIVPGLFIVAAFMAVNFYIAKKNGLKGSRIRHSLMDILKSTYHAFGALLLPFIILGGIYGGIFTPTEAATTAVVYSLVVGLFIYKELKFKDLKEILISSTATSAMVVFILGAANVLGWLLAYTKLPTQVADAVIKVVDTQVMYLLVLNLILFFVGTLMETLSSIVILAPILVPIGLKLGLDPLHLGLLFVINLVFGFITPPFGVNIFTASSITGLPFTGVVRGVMPYLIVGVICVLIIAYVPPITLWLPTLMFSK